MIPARRFVLSVQTLHAAIPATVDSCLENEQHHPIEGDARQRTTNGLLVRCKHPQSGTRTFTAFTAFTGGYRTWVKGPYGVRERLNRRRIAWEAHHQRLPFGS
ncbi:MAG TPA: hypothetical protein VIU62_05335 [Chloroflexota bacterium]|jgi:hypothetical protein